MQQSRKIFESINKKGDKVSSASIKKLLKALLKKQLREKAGELKANEMKEPKSVRYSRKSASKIGSFGKGYFYDAGANPANAYRDKVSKEGVELRKQSYACHAKMEEDRWKDEVEREKEKLENEKKRDERKAEFDSKLKAIVLKRKETKERRSREEEEEKLNELQRQADEEIMENRRIQELKERKKGLSEVLHQSKLEQAKLEREEKEHRGLQKLELAVAKTGSAEEQLLAAQNRQIREEAKHQAEVAGLEIARYKKENTSLVFDSN
jgi:hypothetical protein